MEQWFVLGLVLASFLFIGVCALYKHLVTDYPEGKRVKEKWGDYRTNLIMHPRARGSHLVEFLRTACMNAVKAIVSAHDTLQKRGVDVAGSVSASDEYFKEYNVWVVPEDMMLKGAAAYITKIDKIPTCVVSDKYVYEIIKTGEPVIHEACHVVLNDYIGSTDDHAAPSIWAAQGGEESLQAVARSVYLELSGTLQAS